MKASDLPPEAKRIIKAMAKYDLKVSQTARKLTYHRNTVTYQCNQIKELTGLDPRKFWDLATLLRQMVEVVE